MRNLLCFLSIILYFACNMEPEKVLQKKPVVREAHEESIKESFSLIAVGDIMLGTDFPDRSKFTTKNILATLADTLKNADVTIGNLEGVLAHDTVPSKKCKDKKNCYAFRSPPAFADYFKTAGIDFLSLANNHSGDFDDEGLQQTMKALDGAGIKYAGLKNICEYAVLEKHGIRIAIIGVGHAWRHVYISDHDRISDIIKKTKEVSDVVIVFFHGGAEGNNVENIPFVEEIFFSENRGNVNEMAHRSVDAGADLVIGSGPHVTRAMELYKGKLIAYSLGNFATYGRVSLHGPMGIGPILKINLSKKGDFLGGRIIATKQRHLDSTTPMIDTTRAVIKKIQKLNAKDFPDNALSILNDGTLTIKNFSN